MNRTFRHGTALAIVLALAGPLCAPVRAEAPSLSYGDTVGENATAQVVGTQSDVTAVGIGDDGANHDIGPNVVANGTVGQDRLYDPQTTGGQTEAIQTDTSRQSLGPNDGVGRYYGDARNTQDLTDTTDEDDATQSTRGKTTLRPRRLAVFNQQYADSRPLVIKPYIEAGQVVDSYLSSPTSTLTYSLVAAGADVLVNGNNNQGIISLRYEHRFGWGRENSGDSLDGIAHVSSAIIPNTLRLDYGGYANRSYITNSGAALPAAPNGSDNLSQIYSAYIGPTLTTHIGPAAVDGHYRVGYTSVGEPPSFTNANAAGPVPDMVHEHSVAQDAQLSIGTRPGEVAPVGLGADAGHYVETVSVLDQKLHDNHVRAEVTIPVSDTTAVVGGVGYEDVQVSSHDAKRDANGNPIFSPGGQFITDYASPRYIAFDSQGLIYDGGVIWRPSRRTNLEVHVGRRYGGFSGFGTFTYRPSARLSVNAVAYDDITGFGGALDNSLFNLPSQFATVRDAITGNVSSCMAQQGATNCLGGVLGSVSSAVHRDRGFTSGIGLDMGRFQTGVGLGYDRHTYIAAPQTVFAAINGKVDQYYWVAAYLSGTIDQQSLFEATVEAYKFKTDVVQNGNLDAIRMVGIYQHYFTPHLSGSAAMSIDGINRDALGDVWSTSGTVGVRYTF